MAMTIIRMTYREGDVSFTANDGAGVGDVGLGDVGVGIVDDVVRGAGSASAKAADALRA